MMPSPEVLDRFMLREVAVRASWAGGRPAAAGFSAAGGG